MCYNVGPHPIRSQYLQSSANIFEKAKTLSLKNLSLFFSLRLGSGRKGLIKET